MRQQSRQALKQNQTHRTYNNAARRARVAKKALNNKRGISAVARSKRGVASRAAVTARSLYHRSARGVTATYRKAQRHQSMAAAA